MPEIDVIVSDNNAKESFCRIRERIDITRILLIPGFIAVQKSLHGPGSHRMQIAVQRALVYKLVAASPIAGIYSSQCFFTLDFRVAKLVKSFGLSANHRKS